MSDLILCDRCNEKRGAFRFEKGSTICRECKRLPAPRQMDDKDLGRYNRQAYKATVNVLAKDPAYKRYLEEYSLRCAQYGSASKRAVGHVD